MKLSLAASHQGVRVSSALASAARRDDNQVLGQRTVSLVSLKSLPTCAVRDSSRLTTNVHEDSALSAGEVASGHVANVSGASSRGQRREL